MWSESTLEAAMEKARLEARAWLGSTAPNPPVGAVALDRAGKILAVAAHRKAGELHAEAALIEKCRKEKSLSQVALILVTLEPCNHHGRTGPCTEAILEAGIKTVVVATRDPNPHVKGGGIDRLRNEGVEIIEGIDEEPCRQLIHSFAYHARTGRPFITLKRAMDKQGSMIPPPGKKVFTSAASLKLAHRLRKKADAILTGSGTILADNPLFTVRHIPDVAKKIRSIAILDRRGRTPKAWLKEAEARGLSPFLCQDPREAVDELTKRGARDILVEAGPALSQTLLGQKLWTMKVDIHQGSPDRIEHAFNEDEPLPFDPRQFAWEHFLPA